VSDSDELAFAEKLGAAWRDVVRAPGEPDEDFFKWGGNSMLAIRLSVAVSDQLGREVEPQLVYYHPTLAAYTAAVLESVAGEPADGLWEPR
jgi:hypothetical protein